MGDHSKSSKSFVDMLSHRSVKNMSNFIQREYGKSNLTKNQINVRPTYNNGPDKSKSSSYSNKVMNSRWQSDSREKDCMKKLIFDNQEMTRKIKELECKCSKLELENNEFFQRYQDIKNKYLKLIAKFEDLHLHPEKPRFQNDNSNTETGNGNIFEKIFKGAMNDSKQRQQDQILLDVSNKVFIKQPFEKQKRSNAKQSHQVSILIEKESKTTESVSIVIDSMEAETQTQIDMNLRNQLASKIREIELRGQIDTQKLIISELEKKYIDVLNKYSKIKNIIGGSMMSAH